MDGVKRLTEAAGTLPSKTSRSRLALLFLRRAIVDGSKGCNGGQFKFQQRLLATMGLRGKW